MELGVRGVFLHKRGDHQPLNVGSSSGEPHLTVHSPPAVLSKWPPFSAGCQRSTTQVGGTRPGEFCLSWCCSSHLLFVFFGLIQREEKFTVSGFDSFSVSHAQIISKAKQGLLVEKSHVTYSRVQRCKNVVKHFLCRRGWEDTKRCFSHKWTCFLWLIRRVNWQGRFKIRLRKKSDSYENLDPCFVTFRSNYKCQKSAL